MTSDTFCLGAAVTLVLASAQAAAHTCRAESFKVPGLQFVDCNTEENLQVATFGGPEPLPRHATEFDEELFYVATAKSESALLRRIGVRQTTKGLRLESTRLARPPCPDGIVKRRAIQRIHRIGNWTVLLEDIEYFSTRHPVGYVVLCGTAIHAPLYSTRFVAASECLPYGEQRRFFKRLEGLTMGNAETGGH